MQRQEGENNGRETDMSPLLRVGCKLTANRKSINNDNHNNNLEAGDTHIQPGNQKSICGGVNIEEMLMAQEKKERTPAFEYVMTTGRP